MTVADWRRGPDRLDRALGAGALVMLAALLAALARGHSHWGHVPWPIWLHLVTVATALTLTPLLLRRQRGDRRHRWPGYGWMAAMLITALDSFLIRGIFPGSLSPIHLLSAFVLWQLAGALVAARRHDHARHRAKLRGITLGGLLIAGALTLPAGRMLGSWLFG